MKVSIRRNSGRAGAFICLVSLASGAAFAESAAISLRPVSQPEVVTPVTGEASFANAPANFRSFPAAHVGTSVAAQELTLDFAAPARLTSIAASKDFKVVQSGGSCALETLYSAGASCTLLVQFTPQGAGARLGKLTIENTASATPLAFGLGGYGYSPVVSFTPALISTVPATYPSGVALLSGATNLAVDGGDTLYMADTGNNLVRYMDSSGVIRTLASGYSAPVGIAVDTFGEVYFSRPAANALHEVYDYGPVVTLNGAGTGACTASAPCTLSSHTVTKPSALSMDPYNHLIFAEETEGAAMSTVQPLPQNLIFLYDPFPYQTVTPGPIATDAGDNIYSFWTTGGNCQLVTQSLYNAENSNVIFNKIAGGHTCGFSGDNGQAGNAEIGNAIGQMAFDIAGNLYFSDSANQRVRRIDYVTGLIRTIAGTGTAGYTGDGAQAVSAELSSPTGVGVDSQGQVFIISSAATGQVVRKLGPNGFVSFGPQLHGTATVTHILLISNTGNSQLVLTNAVFAGADPGDFSIDPLTTSCLLTPGAVLNAGQSCKVGLIFKPAATGVRTANFVLLDNTVTNSNIVQLSGSGT